MFKRFIYASLFGLLAITLTACPSAGTEQDVPVLTGVIPANDIYNQDVLLQSGLNGDLIYFELGEAANTANLSSEGISVVGNLKLYVTEQSGKVLFSNGPKYFYEYKANKILESAGIIVGEKAKTECRGPCVIEQYSKISSDFKVSVKIANGNNFPLKFKLFAFVTKSADKNEPNGSAHCAVKVHPTSTLGVTPTKNIVLKGALEFLSDVDCFEVPEKVSSVVLETTSKNATGVKAVIWEIGANHPLDSITLAPGAGSKTISVTNKKIKVFVSPVHRAGPANSSSYTLTIK